MTAKLTKPTPTLSTALQYRSDQIRTVGQAVRTNSSRAREFLAAMEQGVSNMETHAAEMNAAAQSAYIVQLERDALAAAVKAIVFNFNGDLAGVWTEHPIIDVALRS